MSEQTRERELSGSAARQFVVQNPADAALELLRLRTRVHEYAAALRLIAAAQHDSATRRLAKAVLHEEDL